MSRTWFSSKLNILPNQAQKDRTWLRKMTSRCKSRRQFASKAKTSVFTVCNPMRNFLIVIYFTKENYYLADSYGATSTATDQAAFIKGRAFVQGVNFKRKSIYWICELLFKTFKKRWNNVNFSWLLCNDETCPNWSATGFQNSLLAYFSSIKVSIILTILLSVHGDYYSSTSVRMLSVLSK